jgi:excinuclease ABC subunit B
MSLFELKSSYRPTGDQPQAIESLVDGIERGKRFQTLLGVTGSGKTFTIANVIARCGKPALIISHNKTLAAQLYGELKGLFPRNAVEYFISYYDYYQPEAFLPATETYIEKDVSINEDIDRLRLRTTGSLMTRRDVIVVASVSCIYGLGSPDEFEKMTFGIAEGSVIGREELLAKLVLLRYARNDLDFVRGTFRVRGDTLELRPAYTEDAIRIEMFDDEIERISVVHPITGEVLRRAEQVTIFPSSHFVIGEDKVEAAVRSIKQELKDRVRELESEDKNLEARRLETRTLYDLEMLREMGYCNGIENYSRHLSNRKPGERPATLIDYFGDDFLTVIDESHVTVSQIGAMYEGDRSRKLTLIEHGFRLPSALDNRPLRFEEFEKLMKYVLFASATPGDFELKRSEGEVVEQIVRPTGLVDPVIHVRPVKGQIDDLLSEIRKRVEKSQRVFVTTLTKRMSEDLTDYLSGLGVRVRYLHSDIKALDRVEILRDLRFGEFDVLVGINLLREGLDLPEVSLVAVLDADKEGFLRSRTSLIQTSGRAARNIDGTVIFYANNMTGSMRRAIDETNRRREKQITYNEAHDITPRSIVKSIEEIRLSTSVADAKGVEERGAHPGGVVLPDEVDDWEMLRYLEEEMLREAEALNFERAASIRDRIEEIRWNLTRRKSRGKSR